MFIESTQVQEEGTNTSTARSSYICCFKEALQKVTVSNDSTEWLFVYAVAQQMKEPQFNVGGNSVSFICF